MRGRKAPLFSTGTLKFLLVPMKVRHTQEWDVPHLAETLGQASTRSSKTITEICATAQVSTSFWYGILSGKQQSIKLETLKNFCRALDLDLSEILRKEK